MHILFIGYGKTSWRIAKQLFEQGHQITTISQSPKMDEYATHLIQDVHQLNLDQIKPIDWVYILLSPNESTPEAYQRVYVDSVQPISKTLKQHPVQKVVVVSSTRVYGENHGERINDESEMKPNDEQGRLLLKMELLWQQAYPSRSIMIRPTGIYGTSVARMLKLAEKTKTYPNLHWSNRIHIDDLATFLASMIHVEHAEKSYIVSNNQPSPLHESIQWFQRQLHVPELVLQSDECSGKRIYATRMAEMGFQLQHENCFEDYLEMLGKL
ncbi:NAD(P)-dependent oxidoreductase [Acinetobacter sp. ANC 4470]|uniref:sugar nucleotide-binding protein n=1 Tax=Acinetobacter sp. ANC 4470 TaxID=1977881 RepID=UPI000A35A809|nr:sugar nucleotide-binding protein [Acinetobacter sp. ANC 4470]OTG65325.1 NAD(P)-dependent oxidoreductase [Acinetobacter sp. ANC 4470]